MTNFDRYEIIKALISQINAIESRIAKNPEYTLEDKRAKLYDNAEATQGIIDRLIAETENSLR